MVSFSKLKDMFGNNVLSYSTLSFADISTIMEHVMVSFEINQDSLEYYYCIGVDDLMKSDITDDILSSMVDSGWSFNETNDELVLYIRS